MAYNFRHEPMHLLALFSIAFSLFICTPPSVFAEPGRSCSPWESVPTTFSLNGLTQGRGLFVGVGSNGTIFTSPDGKTWSPGSGTTATLDDVVWTGSQFLAVGCGGGLADSPDGITWSTRSGVPSNTCLQAVAWSGLQYVAVGYSNNIGEIWTSFDGLHWVRRTTTSNGDLLLDIIWSGTRFVAVSSHGGVLTSSDGTTWSYNFIGQSVALNAIAWNGSLFVAVTPSKHSVFTSPDGTTWTEQSGNTRAASAIIWAGTRFISTVGNGIMTSPDGINWTQESSGGPSLLNDVAWDGGIAVTAGGAGVLWRSQCQDVSRVPQSNFSWTPTNPNVGQTVQFTNTSTGAQPSWAWDFNADGVTDSTAKDPVHTFSTLGPHQVSLRATNAYGVHHATKIVLVGGTPGSVPVITSVQREYVGFFLHGTQTGNRFSVTVNWNGSPGTVSFSANGGAAIIEPGTTNGTSHVFNLGSFPARFQPSTITIKARNGAGIEGPAWTEQVFLFPHPSWLEEALLFGDGDIEIRAGGGEIEATIGFEFPKPHLQGIVHIPEFVPYIGGDLGFEETFAKIEGEVSSIGTGSLNVFGQTGFVALGQPPIYGHVRGSGQFRLLPPEGLDLTGASFAIGLSGTIRKEVGVVEAIPLLASIADLPVINWFNERAKLTGEISPSLELATSFSQENGELEFQEATGTLGLDLRGILNVNVIPRLTATGWVSGGGSALVGVPEPFFREMQANVEAGVELNFDYFFGAWEGRFRCRAACTWTHGGSMDCPRDCDAESVVSSLNADQGSISLIDLDYGRFGRYSEPANVRLPKIARSIVPVTVDELTIANNVFPGSSPQRIEAVGGELLLWEYQDPDEPVLQSTEIVWSFGDGSGWTTPTPVVDDRRAELSPVAGRDATGKVVAAWLRIKDSSFSTPIEDVGDLPLFYKRLEVVTALFNPASSTWGPVSQLTDDTGLDTDLRISSDHDGNLLLTWLSNPEGEFLSTADSPSTLFYSVWNSSTETWSAPAPVATGLIGVSVHTSAINGSQAFILVSRDPNLVVSGDGVLDLYTWNGSSWSGGSTFAAGGVENRIPVAVYDATGEGHAVWLCGNDLVIADLSNPTPRPVRTGSSSMAFYGMQFFTNPQGNLTLVWQEMADNQPANIFARIFDPASGTWSDDRRLTAEEEVKHHDLSGFYGSDGILRAVYLATQVERITREVDLEGQTYTLTNLPQDGRTDLRLLDHSLIVDLAVVDADLVVTPASPELGEQVVAVVTVHNAGDFTVGSFDVSLFAGAPDDGGVLVGQSRIDGPFPAGDRIPLTITFTYPATGGDIVVLLDSSDEVTELTDTNNHATHYLENGAPRPTVLATITNGVRPLTVEFDASASFDPNGDSMRFVWSFGDGSSGAESALVSHTFEHAGIFPVTLAVTDSKGAVGTAIVVITVSDIPPTSPSGLQAVAISPTGVQLTWVDPSDNEDGFRLFRSTASGAFIQLTETGPGVVTYFDTGLVSNTDYAYQVEAFNEAGASARSNIASTRTPHGSCSAASTLSCNSTHTWSSNGSGSTNAVQSYGCLSGLYSGPEYTYSFNAPESTHVQVTLSGLSSDLDAVVLRDLGNGCSSNNCFTHRISRGNANEEVKFGAIGGHSYQVVVDGLNGASGNYTIQLTCDGPTFADVPSENLFFNWINALYNAGVTGGCSVSPRLYCPANHVSRAEMAIFLERGLKGRYFVPSAATGIFTDVPVSDWRAPWVEQLYRDGITAGCNLSPLQYCPLSNVTRAQMAVFLLRARYGTSYSPPPATGIFEDVPESHLLARWIEQLYREGITSGCSTSPLLFCPDGDVTRETMAVFLVRTFNLPLP